MAVYRAKFTPYFLNVVPRKHPEVKLEWVERIVSNPIKQMTQADGRIVYWGNIPEMGDRALRVITLEMEKPFTTLSAIAIFIGGNNEGKNHHEAQLFS